MANDRRPTRSALLEVLAECDGCTWTGLARNSLALAALHHDSTGHVVTTRITRVVVYGDRDAALRASGQTSLLEE